MVDVLSALGLGIGAISLCLQITDECIKKASHMPESYQYLRVRVQIEQQRFLSFALEAGLLSAEGKICGTLRVNQAVLKAVLVEIKALFENYEKANGKYVETMPQGSIDWTDSWEPQTELMEKLCVTHRQVTGEKLAATEDMQDHSRYKVLRKFGNKTRKLRTVFADPKRLVWVTADRESFESLVRRLADLNSFLIALLDTSQMKRLEQQVQRSYLEILQLREGVRSLETLIQALTREKKDEAKEAPYPSPIAEDNILSEAIAIERHSDEKKREHLKTLTSIKIRCTQIDQIQETVAQPTIYETSPMMLDIASFSLRDLEDGEEQYHSHPGRRTSGSWNGRNIWIEWLDYPSNYWQMKEKPTVLVENRVILLTRLLREAKPTGFRAPPCLGYVTSPIVSPSEHDSSVSRFGIAFEKPPVADPSSKLTTLRHILGTRPKPPLSARIALCVALAECIYSFHAVNWLHKGLRSENIVFFRTDDTTTPTPEELGSPYVTGFELSRPSSELEMTAKPVRDPAADIYRHPHAQSGEAADASSYRKSYDLYSFGIVLLEIARWKPIEKILGFEDVAAVPLRDVQPLLAGRSTAGEEGKGTRDLSGAATSRPSAYLRKAADRCGDAYADIVELCLGADAVERPAYRGESSASVNARLRIMFEEQAMGRLRLMQEALKGGPLGGDG
ncbi:prion-inhibition and propagation-domain-containing protein [Whalleya microplaca]|nr:prion-inhibition and propagation-domain-containing protein [Whalleya microplaca]